MNEFYDPFKDLRFEHDGPSEDEQAEVAATVEAEGEEIDSAASEAEVEVEGPFEKAMAWEGYENAPLMRQMARIASLTAFAKEQFALVSALVDEGGLPDDILPCPLTLGSKDEQVISYALNLVGFFNPMMADAAHALAEKLTAAVDEKPVPDDVKERIESAMESLSRKHLASMFGMTVEEYEAKLKEAIEAEGDAIVSEAEVAAESPPTDVSLN